MTTRERAGQHKELSLTHSTRPIAVAHSHAPSGFRSIFGVLTLGLTSLSCAMDIRDGLLLHYDFNQPGERVEDRSDFGRDGHLRGATWVPAGIGEGALYLDKPFAGVVADDTGLPAGDAPRSVSWWFALDELRPADNTEFISYGTFRHNQFVALAIDWRHGRDCPAFSQYGGAYLSGRRIDQERVWYHAVFTYGGNGKYTYYINGEKWPGTAEMSGPITTQLSGTLTIGTYDPTVNNLKGFIDEVRIYDRELVLTDVRTLFDEGREIAGVPVDQKFAASSSEATDMNSTNRHMLASAASTASPREDPVQTHKEKGSATHDQTIIDLTPHLLRIGLSNAADGDQDVTFFYPGETLFVTVEDVDIGRWNTNVTLQVMISQRDAQGQVQRAENAVLALEADQLFRGQLPLAGLIPGYAQLDITGIDLDHNRIVLMRSSWIRIMAP